MTGAAIGLLVGAWVGPAAADSVPVVRVADPPTAGSNENQGLTERIMVALKSWGKEHESAIHRVEVMSRGAESARLAIPLLSSPTPQTMVAGTRPFRFMWVGGRPPFSVTLAGPSGGDPQTWQAGEARSINAVLRFEEGPYEVRIMDAAARSVLGSFQATSTEPAVDRRHVDSLPPNLANAVLAARLAVIDDGAWRLEAYQRLAADPDDWAARTTADRLIEGLSLADLRKAAPADR